MSEIFFPVYKDTFYTTSATTLDYSVSTDDDGVIFRGRAYKGSASEIAINISKIASDYLENKYNDAKSALTSNMVLWHHQNAFKYFYLYDGAGNLLNTYGVLFDFDNDFAGNSMILSDPIKPEISYQQVMPYSLYSRNGEIVKLYWETKDTYWNLISSAVTIPFQGGDTRILWETDYHPYRNWSVDIPGVSPFSYNSASEDGITVWVPAINTIADQTYNIYYIYNGTTFGYTVATQKGASFTFSPDPAVIGSFSGDSVNVSWYTQVTGATYTYETDGTLFDIVVNGNTATLTAKADNDTFSANTGWLKVYVNGELGGTLTVQQEGKYFNLLTDEILFVPEGGTNNVGWSTNILPASLTVVTDDTGFTVANVTASGCSVTASPLPDDNPRIGSLSVYSGSTLLGRLDLLQGEEYLEQIPFTIKFISGGTLQISKDYVYTDHNCDIYYRKNGGSWKTLTYVSSSITGTTISADTNDVFEFKKNASYFSGLRQPVAVFRALDGKIKAYGNTLSLLYYDDYVGKTTLPGPDMENLAKLFSCQPQNAQIDKWSGASYNLVDVRYVKLPATELSNYDYQCMFSHCRAIKTAPELPAITLNGPVYNDMFRKCIALTSVPDLPATTLGRACYNGMFRECTSLVNPPSVAAVDFPTSACTSMFSGCTALISTPSITLHKYSGAAAYSRMFEGCTSLTNVRMTMPGRYISSYQCYHMFRDCTSLVSAPIFTEEIVTGYTYEDVDPYGCDSMFEGCSSLTTPPLVLPATRLSEYAYDAMFKGCSSLVTPPRIKATGTLHNKSYSCSLMFKDCTSLTSVAIIGEKGAISGDNSEYEAEVGQYAFYHMYEGCTSLTSAKTPRTYGEYAVSRNGVYVGMFGGCTSLVAAVIPDRTLYENCYSYMFSGCTNLNAITIYAGEYGQTSEGTYPSQTACTRDWVAYVAPTGTFYYATPTGDHSVIWTTGNSGIPTGWTAVEFSPPD